MKKRISVWKINDGTNRNYKKVRLEALVSLDELHSFSPLLVRSVYSGGVIQWPQPNHNIGSVDLSIRRFLLLHARFPLNFRSKSDGALLTDE